MLLKVKQDLCESLHSFCEDFILSLERCEDFFEKDYVCERYDRHLFSQVEKSLPQLIAAFDVSFYDKDDKKWFLFLGHMDFFDCPWDSLEDIMDNNSCYEDFDVFPLLLPFFHEDKKGVKCTPFLSVFIDESEVQVISFKRQIDKNDIKKKVSAFCKKLLHPLEKKQIIYSRHQSSHTKDSWKEEVNGALRRIRQGDFEKEVLFRKESFFLSESFSNIELSHILLQDVGERYFYKWKIEDNHTFLGLTPELIYFRNQDQLYVEALAGTVSKSKTFSPKEKKEHQIVVDFVEHKVKNLCLKKEPKSYSGIRDSGIISHLLACFSGQLKPDVCDKDILLTLYPSPAIARYPYFFEKSAFNRDYYSGVMLLLSKNKTKSVLMIRCADYQEDRLTLYAGAGIIDASKPDVEWQEIQSKMYPLWEALQHD